MTQHIVSFLHYFAYGFCPAWNRATTVTESQRPFGLYSLDLFRYAIILYSVPSHRFSIPLTFKLKALSLIRYSGWKEKAVIFFLTWVTAFTCPVLTVVTGVPTAVSVITYWPWGMVIIWISDAKKKMEIGQSRPSNSKTTLKDNVLMSARFQAWNSGCWLGIQVA